MMMSWDEALEIWRVILGRVTRCAKGEAEYSVLDQRECQAMVIIMMELAKELSPGGFSARRGRAHY